MHRPAGRVGSGLVWSQKPHKLTGRVGSGHGFRGSGRVGSVNLDPRATLLQTNIIAQMLSIGGEGEPKCAKYTCRFRVKYKQEAQLSQRDRAAGCVVDDY